MAAQQMKLSSLYSFLSKQCSRKTMYIEFKRKSDSTLRKMTFQLTGSRPDNGNRLPIHRVLEDVNNNTLTVWDLNKDEYRRLNLLEVTRLVIDQDEFDVIP
jgi:hypothetical protein